MSIVPFLSSCRHTVAISVLALLGIYSAKADVLPQDFSVDAELTLASQFRSRGIMQTNNKPAIQGGFTLSHSSGLYIGNWNSSISWLSDSDPNVSAPIETDFFAGYAAAITDDVSMDVGLLQYYYPGSFPGDYVRPYTTEAYLAVSYGPVQFKYSHTLSNLFGIPNSQGSQYYDLSGKFPLGVLGIDLSGHVGYQRVRNFSDASYTDWSLGLSKTWGGFTAALHYVDTNADRDLYVNTQGRYTGSAAAILTLTQRF